MGHKCVQIGECIQTQLVHCADTWAVTRLEKAKGNKGRDPGLSESLGLCVPFVPLTVAQPLVCPDGSPEPDRLATEHSIPVGIITWKRDGYYLI